MLGLRTSHGARAEHVEVEMRIARDQRIEGPVNNFGAEFGDGGALKLLDRLAGLVRLLISLSQSQVRRNEARILF